MRASQANIARVARIHAIRTDDAFIKMGKEAIIPLRLYLINSLIEISHISCVIYL